MQIKAITGGIGSGKTAAARYLKKLGAYIIDADATAHELSAPHGAIWEKYVEHFGQEILLPDGTMDRKKIADIIYADEKERQWVNNVTHPLIKQAMENELAKIKENATTDTPQAVFFDIPLLFETGWDKYFSSVWVVYVTPEIQLERLTTRRGMAKEEAQRIIKTQMPAEEKIAKFPPFECPPR